MILKKLAIHSILRLEGDLKSSFGQNSKKTVSCEDIVHFIDEENVVTNVDFDCGVIFYTETPTKIKHINRERKYISRSCEKPKWNHSNDQYNCSIDERHSPNVFLNLYNLWDKVPPALMSLNLTNERYSMSNQYPQPTTEQPRTDSYPVFFPLRTMDIISKGLRINFAFFQRNYLPEWRVNETVATVQDLSDLWEPGAMDGIP